MSSMYVMCVLYVMYVMCVMYVMYVDTYSGTDQSQAGSLPLVIYACTISSM